MSTPTRLTLQLHSLVLNQDLPPALPIYTENINDNLVPNQIPVPHSPLAGTHRYPMSATELPSGQCGGSFPTVPAPPSIPSTQLSAHLPERTKPIPYDYGDCGESLPLVAMTNVRKITTRAEIRSVAAFVTNLRVRRSIPEDGCINASIRLRGPCRNCESLMQRFPETVEMLAGSGNSKNICWMTGNQSVCISDVYSASQSPPPPQRYDNFSLAAAYRAKKKQIYRMLQKYALLNGSPFLSAELRNNLEEVWHSLVVPYRDHGTVFHINLDDNNVQPLIVTINGVKTPLCSVFCAIGFILSTILWTTRVGEQQVSFLPLMTVLAKWCYTLCPWGHPNVVSVAYTLSQDPGLDIRFLLGTSKPTIHSGKGFRFIKSKHKNQMRIIRKALLEDHFGKLEEPCPQMVAAGY